MFTADLSGLSRLIAQLEQRSVDYQIALDSAVDLAQSTILNRVRLGQLVDGSYRVSNTAFNGSRYSERQYKYRSKAGKPTGIHTLYVDGNLHKNFVVDKGQTIGKNNRLFVRKLGFTNNQVPNKDINYGELAAIQERKTGIGFQLSPSQLIRVMARFKQVARL